MHRAAEGKLYCMNKLLFFGLFNRLDLMQYNIYPSGATLYAAHVVVHWICMCNMMYIPKLIFCVRLIL